MNLVDQEVYDRFRELVGSNDWKTLRLLRQADQEVLYRKAERAHEKLNEALKECRKELKIYARKSFSCCGSCGSYELANKCDETGKKGYLFYSRQSKDNLTEGGRVYFNFSAQDKTLGDDAQDDLTKKLGENVVRIFKKNGVNVEWDGNTNTAILVKV